ncbi:MAG: pyridoxamine 5'-phosphate oxidase family protein [Rubrivivax sp.]|nr:pyridoxamine 5'-phosphate oxidase family protein [Rubrivivax sp.]
MKIEPQSCPDWRDLAHRLHSHRVAMLTLLEASSALTSRPMTPLEMDGNGAIWIMASREAMQRQMVRGRSPAPVNLAFMGHGEGDYVSIAGHAEWIDDAQRKRELWSATGRPWFDGPMDPDLVLLKVTPLRAEIWDGPDSVVTHTLATTAAAAPGRELGVGRKDMTEIGWQRRPAHS